MDAQQALADLTEISSQIQTAVAFDEKGKVLGSTPGADARAAALAEGAGRLLDEAASIQVGDSALTQLEVATSDGSVFVVSDGKTRVAATTAPQPTVGLVFYDLKSALRSMAKPAPARKRAPAKKTTATTAAKRKPAAPRKKKTDAT